MLHAAELGALPVVCTGLIALYPHDVVVVRHHVHFARYFRYPEAVNHVNRVEIDVYHFVYGNMQVAREDDVLGGIIRVVISELEPPLVADHVNGKRPGFGGNLVIEDGEYGGYRYQDYDGGRAGSPGEFESVIALDLFGNVVVSPPAELDEQVDQSALDSLLAGYTE